MKKLFNLVKKLSEKQLFPIIVILLRFHPLFHCAMTRVLTSAQRLHRVLVWTVRTTGSLITFILKQLRISNSSCSPPTPTPKTRGSGAHNIQDLLPFSPLFSPPRSVLRTGRHGFWEGGGNYEVEGVTYLSQDVDL